MLAHRLPAEAKLQPDLDVGAAMGVELLSTPEVVVREASLAAGWLLGLAADSLNRGSGCADLPSDRSGGHAGGLQAEYLLLLRRVDRTADRLADTASRRGLARPKVGATLGKFDSGTTSAAMKRPRKTSQGSHSLV